jgi:hypothetical protein
MGRLVCVAVVSVFVSAPAAAQTVSKAPEWRLPEVTVPAGEPQMPAIEVGPSGRFGLGMFGLKSGAPRSRAVVGHEVSAPKQRRAGVGFSLKF